MYIYIFFSFFFRRFLHVGVNKANENSHRRFNFINLNYPFDLFTGSNPHVSISNSVLLDVLKNI